MSHDTVAVDSHGKKGEKDKYRSKRACKETGQKHAFVWKKGGQTSPGIQGKNLVETPAAVHWRAWKKSQQSIRQGSKSQHFQIIFYIYDFPWSDVSTTFNVVRSCRPQSSSVVDSCKTATPSRFNLTWHSQSTDLKVEPDSGPKPSHSIPQIYGDADCNHGRRHSTRLLCLVESSRWLIGTKSCHWILWAVGPVRSNHGSSCHRSGRCQLNIYYVLYIIYNI